MLREMQVRLVYSLLKPAAAFAAAFGIPIKSLVDLFRLAYFEHLAKQGRTQREIAEYFGQSDRHIRSLAQRLKGDFFASEREIGLTRELEEFVAAKRPTEAQIWKKFSMWDEASVQGSLARLLEQGRAQLVNGKYSISTKYTVLHSDQFKNRIDALNHFLDAAQHAVAERLVEDNRTTAMVKTISFSGSAAATEQFIKELEGFVRARIATIEEEVQFSGTSDGRYAVALLTTPLASDTLNTSPSLGPSS